MAYILGFIYTDGSVDKYTLSFELQARDVEVLEFIRNELCPEAIIEQRTKKARSYVRLRIHSRALIISLNQLGVYANKSLTVKLGCIIPKEYVGDFVRGTFDGDGWVHCRRNSIETGFVSASKTFVLDLQKLSGDLGIIRKREKLGKNKVSITYCLEMRKSDSMKLKELMYSTEAFSLKRKREKLFSDFYIRSQKRWTEEQKQLLIENYKPNCNLTELSTLIGRSYKAVSKKIWELSLNENRNMR